MESKKTSAKPSEKLPDNRMQNRLKAEHEDDNVCLSSIVDDAIRYYYDLIFYGKEMSNKE